MAGIFGLIGANIIGSIGGGIAEGLREKNRRDEWKSVYDLNHQKMENDFTLGQRNLDLQQQRNDYSLYGGLAQSAIGAGSGIIGGLFGLAQQSRQHEFQQGLINQQRTDLTNDGLPLSYLHLGGRGMNMNLQGPALSRTQTVGRSVSQPIGFANSGGLSYREQFGPPPPYSPPLRANESVDESRPWP